MYPRLCTRAHSPPAANGEYFVLVMGCVTLRTAPVVDETTKEVTQ